VSGRRAKTVLAVAAAVVGVAVALVGVAVLGVGRDVAAQDDALRYAAAPADPSPHARPFGVQVGEALLGVEEDRLLRDAAELAKSAGVPGEAEAIVVTRRAEAEALLTRVLRDSGDPIVRSRASNLLGVLLFEDAKAARGNARRFLEQSLGGFQDAVTLDPTFSVAKANLEVLARLPAGAQLGAVGTQGEDASSSGGGESGY
jgi:hypothetical protein